MQSGNESISITEGQGVIQSPKVKMSATNARFMAFIKAKAIKET